MVDQKLLDYITLTRKKGFTDNSIRETLLKHGFLQASIDAAFSLLIVVSPEDKAVLAKYIKIPKKASDRLNMEIAIAKVLETKKDMFTVSDILKKIDELFRTMTREERIDIYEDIKKWTGDGELCKVFNKEKGVKFFKFI